MRSILITVFGASVLLAIAGCGSKQTTSNESTSTANSETTSTSTSTGQADSTAPAPATGSATGSATAASSGGSCKLLGEFTGKTMPGPTPMNDKDVTVNFTEDSKSIWQVATNKNIGAFTLDDKGAFTIANTGEEAGKYSCAKGQVGKYTATWENSCQSITFNLTDDACKGRSQAMNGIKLTRKK